MATHDNEKRDLPQVTPASAGNATKETEGKPDETRDPDLYDPVGMAGQKTGIVKELEQELKQEGRDPRRDTDKETATETGSGTATTGNKQGQA